MMPPVSPQIETIARSLAQAAVLASAQNYPAGHPLTPDAVQGRVDATWRHFLPSVLDILETVCSELLTTNRDALTIQALDAVDAYASHTPHSMAAE